MTTVVMSPVMFGPRPQGLQCPHCHAQIVTQTKTQTGAITWISCVVCCLIGCWLGCCMIPFCVPELQDVEHTCPNCKNFLGVYRKC